MSSPTPAIASIHTPDNILSRFQQNVITGVQGIQGQLNNTPSGGTFLKNISLSSGNNNITHNLGKTPQGFIVTDIDSASTIYRVSYSSSLVVLNASAPATVTIFLF